MSERNSELDTRVLRRTETLASDVSLIASEFLAGFQAVQKIDRTDRVVLHIGHEEKDPIECQRARAREARLGAVPVHVAFAPESTFVVELTEEEEPA